MLLVELCSTSTVFSRPYYESFTLAISKKDGAEISAMEKSMGEGIKKKVLEKEYYSKPKQKICL
jgi:hypothetical protein